MLTFLHGLRLVYKANGPLQFCLRIHFCKRSVALTILLLTCLMYCANICFAQTFSYSEGGYFKKNGDQWEEWKNGRSSCWATYSQYHEDSDFYYISNSSNSVAVPKNNSVNDFYINKGSGHDWSKVYSHVSNQSYADNSHIYTSRVNCVMCGGSKVCNVCNGSRVMTVTGLFLGNQHTLPCAACDATGICSSCRGNGYTIIDNGLLNGVGSGSSNKSSNNYYNNNSYGSSNCGKCRGTGVCSTCRGKGSIFSLTYAVNKWIDCPECSGSKKCSLCNGSGR